MSVNTSECEGILSACEETPMKQNKSHVILVPAEPELFLEYAFVLLPGVADRSKLAPDHSYCLLTLLSLNYH